MAFWEDPGVSGCVQSFAICIRPLRKDFRKDSMVTANDWFRLRLGRLDWAIFLYTFVKLGGIIWFLHTFVTEIP